MTFLKKLITLLYGERFYLARTVGENSATPHPLPLSLKAVLRK